ncbi:MAG TPA: hypothetical protein VMZ27_13525 [Candidatus Saccharimonadales bacterium]|nr:hypothetical protein [Candidatus Saccharimonadales bacterium]
MRSLLLTCTRIADAIQVGDIDGWRSLLIVTGQLEQAVLDRDSGNAPELPTLASELMDEVAAAFQTVWSGAKGPERLGRVKARLQALQDCGDYTLKVKVPEGFAFYSLFPEQYSVAAAKWAAQHEGERQRRALVVGIRSIGTTLSAIVSAGLRAQGWSVERLTVRPTGPPFRRRVELSVPKPDGIRFALIVDEGPGASGSSMAGVAEWLAQAGFAEIAFFPGHDGGPGPMASTEIQGWWSRAPRYFVPLEEIRWGGRSLTELLSSCAAESLGEVTATNDLSAGNWRSWAYKSPESWPAVCEMFERRKILCAGEKSGVLWKFAGLAGETNGHAHEGMYSMGLSPGEEEVSIPPIIFARLGFVASVWANGDRLTAQDGSSPTLLNQIGKYIARAARQGLDASGARAGIHRLKEMLYWNIKEALGEQWADGASRLFKDTDADATTLTYGDGRMAPWEWVRTASGQLVKTDWFGHRDDHTLIGAQSVCWDVAGAAVEWNMNQEQLELVLKPLGERRVTIDQNLLRFYLAAYAAFRLGFVTIGANRLEEHHPERGRLQRDLSRYKDFLLRLLDPP